ncbi:MAG: C-GCAxxG-C-C family protein [Bacteroidales bacterium]
MNVNVEEKVKRAVELFNEGYNCSQAVLLAYSDLYGLDCKIAKSISHSFGGGVGRMREMCGAISGLSMLIGLEFPVEDPTDMEARANNYAQVQKALTLFKEKHQTIICRELLKSLKPSNDPIPTERSEYYYSIRPCGRFVEDAARIFGNMINDRNSNF